MNGINLMVEEHVLIKRMLKIVRKACYKAIKTSELVYEDFEAMMDFIKYYADDHHHGKEEKLLFNKMVEFAGPAAEKLVTHGMLVEHDLGRLHMAELRKALAAYRSGDDEAILDVIANAISYTHLLHRHIDKEDQVVYPFAERTLEAHVIEDLNLACVDFEAKQKSLGVQEKYLEVVERLERIYLS